MNLKPTSFRLPSDTLDRIRRLTQPGESRSSVILRALIALEGSPPPMSLEAVTIRVEAIESRLSVLEYGCSASVAQALPRADSRSAPVVQTADSGSAPVVQTDDSGSAPVVQTDDSGSAPVVPTAESRSESSISSVVQTDADLIQRVQAMKASGMKNPGIAKTLNAEGVLSTTGRQWNKDSVYRLLRDA
jgi:Arc/MetJ-type ribon-helix-helix transcriptional regulator